LSHPIFSFETLKALAPEVFAVALLGLIEAVSISRAVATKSNQRINANQEFIGQGLSNIVGSFFSSYAGAGSFTRSGINYERRPGVRRGRIRIGHSPHGLKGILK
jgi:SulP family sulfate permease